MEITHTEYKRCDLLKVNGRLDSSTAPKLTDALNAVTDDGRYRIIIDFAGLDFISSAGLRALISTQKICKRYNRGEVILSNIPANICASLELAGLTPLFKIFSDTTSAVGNF